MELKVLVCVVLLTLVIPGSLTSAPARVQDIKGVPSDIKPVQGKHEPCLALRSGSGSEPVSSLLSRDRDIPDTVIQLPIISSGEIPVYNSSLLMMVQGLLSKQEILLEYFPADTMLYVTAVTRESVGFYSVRTGQEFWQEIKLFLKRIRLADFGDCRKQAEVLSRVLLGKVAMKFQQKSKAVIIAHNTLSGFPFAVLVLPVLTPGPPLLNARHLVEGKGIVYNNSVTQWLSSRIRKKIREVKAPVENSLAFVGFSPGFSYHECIHELQDADTEISTIGKMFRDNGKAPVLLLNENSNENNFKSIARFSHIVHIATHTINSEEFPEMNGLLFHEFGSDQDDSDKDDGLLSIHEICELKIPADLIVLNSCSSANIRSRIGMNWFSCADCFMKAGARNVLCTLWNVSDRFAEKFMVEFYRYYLAGMSFSKALQQVKVKMINEPSTSLPVNWAAYILIGE